MGRSRIRCRHGTHEFDPFAASILPTPIVTASQAGLSQTLHQSQKTSFAPRVGFAWRATADGKTVIRGGYGRFVEAMLGTLTAAGWAVSASSVGSYTNTLVNGKPQLTLAGPRSPRTSLSRVSRLSVVSGCELP